MLAVELDSTERADIPPFGGEIDYLTFGGIYRDVRLRLVQPAYIENIFAKPRDVLTDHPSVEVSCFVARLEKQTSALALEVELRDGERVVANASKTIPPAGIDRSAVARVALNNFGSVEQNGTSKIPSYTRLWFVSSSATQLSMKTSGA